MDKRLIQITIKTLAAISLMLSLLGCGIGFQPPKKLSFQGLVLTLWDSPEPSFQGADSYDKLALSVVENFCSRHKIQIDMKFCERRQILSLLLGQESQESSPSIVFSTEWPVAPDGAQNLTGMLDEDGYLDGAIHYWTTEKGLFGIPSYFYWVGMAAKSPVEPQEGLPAGSAYWPDSQWFLLSALDLPEAGFAPEKAGEYLRWLKSSCLPAGGDPLDQWRDGSVSALFPVTPHLYKWLQTTYGPESHLCPIPGPFGAPQFYCTVPGYLVLAEEESAKSCALLLAQELAATRGRWAARNIGALPAAVKDVPVYDLDGGPARCDKAALRALGTQAFVSVPITSEALLRERVSVGVPDLVQGFMKGDISGTDMERGILNLWKSHTKP